jgi:putative membrane protein
MRAADLLDERGIAAITAAVQAAERATSGEIVPVIAERSDPYAELRFGAAALVAFACGALALAFAPALAAWLVPTQLGVFAAAAWLFGRPALLRSLVPDDVLTRRVARAAALAFHDAGLVETRERTGILIYVSLLERHVLVLADRGIHARVEAGTWDTVVARIVAGIVDNRAEAGLADGIRLCGEILADRFPIRPGDVNELRNTPRRS